jgi:ubiquinone/menaquinone biosynthesis C-methylase UbiE
MDGCSRQNPAYRPATESPAARGFLFEYGAVPDISHPLFARFYDRLSRVMERELAHHRDELLAGLTGRVLELGCGNGINFRHYPPSVDEVVAIEPEPYLRARAEHAAASAPVAVTVRAGVAGELQFEDASFDAAVASVVLCSVPDQPAALAELHRLVRRGGELRFLEHVRSDRPGKARVQRTIDESGIWPRVSGGCHCSRNTLVAVEEAGFHVERVRSLDFGHPWMHTNPHVLGVAKR